MALPDHERWAEIERLLDAVLELAPDERDAWLERECPDAALRRDVHVILAADERTGGLLASPTGIFVERLATFTIGDAAGSLDGPRVETLLRSNDPTAPMQLERADEPSTFGDESAGAWSGPRLVGKTIAGYRILRPLGIGGMGAVFEAHEEKMNRRVALKVMARHLAVSDQGFRRFTQEAWIAGKLSHPNLVKVYDHGDWEDLAFYSMELVDGGSLADVVDAMRRTGRHDGLELEFADRRYVPWATEQIVAAARGLDYAHRQGVVHRDIKPMNLLLSREPPTVKVADFGLAFEQDATRMTTEGKVMGTLRYMAPEQLQGRVAEMDARTDVYALGVTLFELVTLQPPFAGDSAHAYTTAVLSGERRRARRINGRVSRDLETVLGKALERRPADRYVSAAAFADDLENVLGLKPIVARPPGALERLLKWARRKPVHATLTVVLAATLPLSGIIGYREAQRGKLARENRIEELTDEIRWLDGRRRHVDVIDRAEQLLAVDPDNTFARTRLALSRSRLADQSGAPPSAPGRQRAVADITRVVETLPDVSWPLRVRAILLTGAGRLAEAEADGRRAAKLRADVPADEELEIDGYLAMARGDYETAAAAYTELSRRRPEAAWAVALRGTAYDYAGDFERAEDEYRIAVGIDPTLDMTFVDLARLATEKEQWEDARNWLDRAFERNPNSASAFEIASMHRARLAVTQLHAGQTDRALELFRESERAARRCIELGSNNTMCRINLGHALTEQWRLVGGPDSLLEEALRSNRDALETFDAPPTKAGEALDLYRRAMTNVCDALIELQRKEDVLDPCRRAVDLWPDNPDVYFNLAGAYMVLDLHDDALAALERDVELGDTDWNYLADSPWFEPLRDDPRFAGLLETMKRRKRAAEASAARS